VGQVVVSQFAARQDAFYQPETGRRAIAHGNRHRAVQFHHRGRTRSLEQIVKLYDPAPVRRSRGGRSGMHSRDCRLHRVSADRPRRQRKLNQRNALINEIPIPQRAVLIIQSTSSPVDEVRVARRDSCNNISASNPCASGSGNNSTNSRPSRMASPERSARVSDSPDEAE